MLAWISVTLGMGILNLLASLYYSHTAASVLLVVNGCIFGLIGIGLGARVRMKIKAGRIEQLRERLQNLESRES